MEIGKRIKELRNDRDWNQEEFAEKVFVSRQTVSSWENDKSYPDIKSLLLMSELFGVTLDDLIKGDIEIMKQTINSEERSRFIRLSYLYAAAFFIAVAIPYPLVHFLGKPGLLVWGLYMVPVMILAFYLEKMKKANDIVTYKEISAFWDQRQLDKENQIAEKAKRPYQQILLTIGAAGLTLAVILLEAFLMN